jgi:hypothetical protein
MADEETTQEPQNGDDSGGAPEGAKPQFTQEDVNRIVAERLQRERSKYEDYDALKDAASKWGDHLEAQKTETQKLTDRLAEEQTQRLEFEEQLAELRIKTAVVTEASKLGVVDTEDVWALLDISAIDDTGKVAAAVAELVEAKPYLKGAQGPSPSQTSPAKPAGAQGRPGSKMDEVREIIWGPGHKSERRDDLWDPGYQESMGGGIVAPQTEE